MLSKAPEFNLPEAPGKTVASDFSSQAGPTVILFFPLAFSGVCTMVTCAPVALGTPHQVPAS